MEASSDSFNIPLFIPHQVHFYSGRLYLDCEDQITKRLGGSGIKGRDDVSVILLAKVLRFSARRRIFAVHAFTTINYLYVTLTTIRDTDYGTSYPFYIC